MRQRVYLQQHGHSDVRLYRFGEWLEAEMDNRRFQFKLRSCQIGGGSRLLLRFRDSAVCQQALLRLEGQQILFKNSYTVAAQRYEPRRTGIEAAGVQEGDVLLGSDVWSVDLLLSDRFIRPVAAVLRFAGGALEALACGESRLYTLSESEEAISLASGSLRLLAQEPKKESFSTLFFVDQVLFELSSQQLGDERAHLRLAAVGYILPEDIPRITLGSREDCFIRLYGDKRARSGEEAPVWNLWFEAVRCKTLAGTVVSAAPTELGDASGLSAFHNLLESYLPKRKQVKQPTDGLVDQNFVIQKAKDVLVWARNQPEQHENARRLEQLLAQENYHEASLLAESLRRQAASASYAPIFLEHGHKFVVEGLEVVFLERARLARQRIPALDDAPGLLMLEKPVVLGRMRLQEGVLQLQEARTAAWKSVPELRLGRMNPDEKDSTKIDLPELNVAVSSQSARIWAQDSGLWIGPWREDLSEGDAVVLNFQVLLEEPEDCAEVKAGDYLLLGNLVLEIAEQDEAMSLLLRGLLMDSSLAADVSLAHCLGLPAKGGAAPQVQFLGGARLMDVSEADGSLKVGSYRIQCESKKHPPQLQLESSGEGMLRFGCSDGGLLAYSLRRRVTRLRQAPLYPVASEIIVGVNWQSLESAPGVEIEAIRQPASYFRLMQKVGPESGLACQAVAAPGSQAVPTHWRNGSVTVDERVLPGDELVCPPVRFRVTEAMHTIGLDFQVDVVAVDLSGARSGMVCGVEAQVGEDELWSLRLPAPFPRQGRVRWTRLGQFQIERVKPDKLTDPLDLELRSHPRFRCFESRGLPDGALRLGGPGAPAEIVHEQLPVGQVVARIEAKPDGFWLHPVDTLQLWVKHGEERAFLTPEGHLLEPGDLFGCGEAELSYDGTWG